MRRRRLAAAAGCCLCFLLGTLLNVLLMPGHDPQRPRQRHQQPRAEGLSRQLRERYEELVRYQQLPAAGPGAGGAARPLERRLMDLAPPQPRAKVELALEPPALGCRQLRRAAGLRYLGSGYTKAVHRAALNRSLAVALKSVDLGGHDVQRCAERAGPRGDCYRLASYKLVKEMILLQRLRHRNVLRVSGKGQGQGRAGQPSGPGWWQPGQRHGGSWGAPPAPQPALQCQLGMGCLPPSSLQPPPRVS